MSYSRWKKKYVDTACLWTSKLADQSLLAAEYFDRSTFWLKNPGIFRRLAISTFHAFVTLLAFRLRLFMGLEFRVWSLLLANGAMDLEHREFSVPSLSLIFPLFFSIFDWWLVVRIWSSDSSSWFLFSSSFIIPFSSPIPPGLVRAIRSEADRIAVMDLLAFRQPRHNRQLWLAIIRLASFIRLLSQPLSVYTNYDVVVHTARTQPTIRRLPNNVGGESTRVAVIGI